MQRLESDKDSLQMQVSILMDQIDAQTEKISDLERGLSERSYQLQRSEETLQKVFIIFFCSQSTISIFFNRVIIIRCFLFSLGDVIPFIGRDAPAGAAQRPVEFEAAIRRSREGKP